MNTNKRTITIAHPMNVSGMLAYQAYSIETVGEAEKPARDVPSYVPRETATASQAARLTQAFGRWVPSNLRSKAFRPRVAV